MQTKHTHTCIRQYSSTSLTIVLPIIKLVWLTHDICNNVKHQLKLWQSTKTGMISQLLTTSAMSPWPLCLFAFSGHLIIALHSELAITGCDSVVTAAHSTVWHEGSEKLLPPFLTATRPFNKWDVVLNEQWGQLEIPLTRVHALRHYTVDVQCLGCIPLFRQPLFRQPLFRNSLFRQQGIGLRSN